MPYTYDRMLAEVRIEDAEMRLRESLRAEGFGVLTEIDVRKTMKAKIGLDVPDYRILGACNPVKAHKAMEMEPRVGAMLPCNIVLRSLPGGTEVSAIDPVASMAAVNNPELLGLAAEVRKMLRRAVDMA